MTNEEATKWVDARLCYGRYTPSIHNPFVKDECFEAGKKAINALERAEKYKWHDLRKNPEDLPSEITIINVAYINTFGKVDIASAEYYKCRWWWWNAVLEDYLTEYGKCDFDLIDESIEVIAWAYIPPFESEVEE